MSWDFLQRYDESWIWRCVEGHAVTESSRNFAELEECMADARQHGYKQGTLENKSSIKRGSRAMHAGARKPRRSERYV